MEETIKCIFCGKDGAPSREHVVPEFAGGSLIIKEVCGVCNAKMGSDFEGPISRSILFRLPRSLHDIQGKRSTPINPFPGTGSTEDGSKVRMDEGGVPYLVPQVEETDLGAQGVEVSMKIDASDKHKLPSILEAKIRRVAQSKWPQMSKSEVDALVVKSIASIPDEHEVYSSRPSIRFGESIDLNHLLLLMMKICFEISFHHHGLQVLNDKSLLLLKEAINGRDVEAKIHGALFPNPDPFSVLPSKEGIHYIILSSNTCYVRLFNLSALFQVVENNSQFSLDEEGWILYEFDYANKKCKKHNFLSYITKHV